MSTPSRENTPWNPARPHRGRTKQRGEEPRREHAGTGASWASRYRTPGGATRVRSRTAYQGHGIRVTHIAAADRQVQRSSEAAGAALRGPDRADGETPRLGGVQVRMRPIVSTSASRRRRRRSGRRPSLEHEAVGAHARRRGARRRADRAEIERLHDPVGELERGAAARRASGRCPSVDWADTVDDDRVDRGSGRSSAATACRGRRRVRPTRRRSTRHACAVDDGTRADPSASLVAVTRADVATSTSCRSAAERDRDRGVPDVAADALGAAADARRS